MKAITLEPHNPGTARLEDVPEPDVVWKVVNADDGSKFWYDATSIDTIKADRFNIWILETNQPPKQYEGIEGDVFRSKTL